ncbi:MAG: winged helix domain-containing protein [Arsenophonus endosymbiont of Dermacentor nuttalli]
MLSHKHLITGLALLFHRSRHELDIAPPDPPYSIKQVIELFNQGNTLYKLNGLRTLCVADQYVVNGEQLISPELNTTAINTLFAKQQIHQETLGDVLNDNCFMQLLTKLINDGYWYFND